MTLGRPIAYRTGTILPAPPWAALPRGDASLDAQIIIVRTTHPQTGERKARRQSEVRRRENMF